MPEPSSTDDALLARLNALKKSSVSFDTTPYSAISSSTPPNPSTSTTTAPQDTLAARFARLGSASPSSSPNPSRTASRAPTIAPGASSHLEGVAEGIGSGEGGETQFNEEDERSLEELLRELGDRNEWDVTNEEQGDMGKMLRDVKNILPAVQKSVGGREEEERLTGRNRRDDRVGDERKNAEELTDWENVEVDVGSGGVQVQRDDHADDGEDEDQPDKKPTEDEEADDIIARIMAELSIEKKYDSPRENNNDDDEDGSSADQKSGSREARPTTTVTTDDDDDGAGLSLPSAPNTLPADSLDATQALEDALTARFASLSSPSPSSKPQTDALGLPSAPSFHPSAKPPKIVSTVKHTDEEIDTWCIICNDDATLKCLGCEGDLYCQNCWMEGHRGENAGYEERRHKAVLYSRKKKGPAAAA